MNLLNVYRCRGGGLLLSANSMHHPWHAPSAGELVGVGVIDAADLDDAVGKDVARQLTDRLFALLPDGILQGTETPWPSIVVTRGSETGRTVVTIEQTHPPR